MKQRFEVLVKLKPGVLDVQGKAIEHSLKDLGYSAVAGVRVGKVIELEFDRGAVIRILDGKSDSASINTYLREQINLICQELLVNSVIESFEVRER